MQHVLFMLKCYCKETAVDLCPLQFGNSRYVFRGHPQLKTWGQGSHGSCRKLPKLNPKCELVSQGLEKYTVFLLLQSTEMMEFQCKECNDGFEGFLVVPVLTAFKRRSAGRFFEMIGNKISILKWWSCRWSPYPWKYLSTMFLPLHSGTS